MPMPTAASSNQATLDSIDKQDDISTVAVAEKSPNLENNLSQTLECNGNNFGNTAKSTKILKEFRRRSIELTRASQTILNDSLGGMLKLKPKGEMVPKDIILSMPWRDRWNFYFTCPEESVFGWGLMHLILFILIINTAVMAAQTLDGPRFESSSPDYDYIPGANFFENVELIFTMIYVLEFLLRLVTTSNKKVFFQSKITWLHVAALLPYFIIKIGHVVLDNTETNDFHDKVNYLRLFRIFRMIALTRSYDGCQIMFKTVYMSIRPLKITLFFLVTIVMVFATIIFYAEPCYDLDTCTFTDIFNAGYFVMVTVATVGYGSQVPSLYNYASLICTCIVMIFGTLYLSMPLAIIGINYDISWREYEDEENRQKRLLSGSIDQVQVDETLQALECRKQYTVTSRVCEKFYTLSDRLIEINTMIFNHVLPHEQARKINKLKSRNDATIKTLDCIVSALKIHKKVCTDIRNILRKEPRQIQSSKSESTTSIQTMTASGGLASKFVSKARWALNKSNIKLMSRHMHTGPPTMRSKIWNILEHNDQSIFAVRTNKARMYMILANIALFYFQTTPEFHYTGKTTVLCRRTIEIFCISQIQPGCFVQNANGIATTIPINFRCSNGDTSKNCYGIDYNYGSKEFKGSCYDAFGDTGVEQVCKSRPCMPGIASFIYDMEPLWIYPEFFFNTFFSIEMVLHAYSHPVPSVLWKDLHLWIDLLCLLPFYTEVGLLIFGIMPTYSVIPSIPNIFAIIRLLKTLRIVKLGTHIPGAAVLLKTMQLVYKRLMIPLFFLFIGCVISAAIFYELERGTECEVGLKCMWWGVNVLTPKIAAGLPLGKRILVQNTQPTKFKDMLRSTWFSFTTFTTVGYGDFVPRTSFGRLFDIFGMVFSACYTAMPLTLVGGQFFICYQVFANSEKQRKRDEEGIHPITPKGESSSITTAMVVKTDLEQLQNAESSKSNMETSTHRSPTSLINRRPLPPSNTNLDNRDAPRPSITAVEIQILNQFIVLRNVLDELVEDLGKLSTMDVHPKVSNNKTNKTANTENFLEIHNRIADDIRFCITVFLNFAPVIEKIIGTHSKPPTRASVVPTIVHKALGTVGAGNRL